MTNQYTTVYLGSPIDDPTERHILERLRADLERRGRRAIIFANFLAGKSYRQIDFLVVLDDHVLHVELKGYHLAVTGAVNGPWQLVSDDGSRRALGEENPYRQTQQGTYGISDDMAELARRDASVPRSAGGRFFKEIDSVICLYPVVPRGSQLQRHPYVSVLDYNELLERSLTPGPRPAWTQQHWEAFARLRGLYVPDERSASERESEAIRGVVADYRRRFVAMHSAGLAPFVLVPASVDGGAIAAADLADLAASQRTVVVTGVSGAGKSHASRHAALRLAAADHLPIWVRGGGYTAGEFHALLRRAVAPYTTETPTALLEAATSTGSIVVIICDGLNECPPRDRPALLEELAALLLRTPAHLMLTTQQPPTLPATMPAILVTLQPPGPALRQEILTAYGVTGLPDDAVAGFRTPLELAIAARCAAALAPGAALAELFDTYVRLLVPDVVRAGLRVVARAADADVRTSLPIPQVIQLLQRSRLGPDTLITAVISTPLLEVDGTRVSFCHELFGRFLAAEDLVVRARSGHELGAMLKDPRHADLSRLALALERDSDRVRDAVHQITDTTVLAAALRGELGECAHGVVAAEAEAALGEAIYATRTDASIDVDPSGLMATGHQGRRWDDFQVALLTAVGRSLEHGLFLGQVTTLFDVTDDLMATTAHAAHTAGVPSAVSAVVSGVFGTGVLHDDDALAASILLDGLERFGYMRFASHAGQAVACTAMQLGAEPNSWTRLYAALLLVDPASEDNLATLPALLQSAWNAGGYHLRLQLLAIVRHLESRLDSATAEAIVAFLNRLQPKHLGLSTALVEALSAYEAITPMRTLASIEKEIQQLLLHPEDPETWDAARRIIGNQLEEAYVGPYPEALAGLSEADRATLGALAVRGCVLPANRWSGWTNRFVLDEFLNHGDSADAIARSALLELARCLNLNDPFLQDAVLLHVRALEACAAFLDAPPPLSIEPAGTDTRAWIAVRTLLFAVARASHDSADVRAAWGVLRHDLPGPAVAALFELHSAAWATFQCGHTPLGRLLAEYPVEMRALFTWGLLHRDEIPAPRARSDAALATFIVATLGIVADAETGALLRRHVTDEHIGSAVVAALRKLDGATGSGTG